MTSGEQDAFDKTSAVAAAAVIDVGSNTVRLVVYSVRQGVLRPVYNEKAPCGLAYGMDAGGRISQAAINEAKAAIARFLCIIKCRRVTRTIVFATSALRDAVNGEDMMCWLREQGVQAQVISGETEGRWTASGAAHTLGVAEGVALDLGGGSLEIARISDGAAVGSPVSLPLGPLRFVPDGDFPAERKAFMRAALMAAVPWESMRGQDVLLIGGAFRNLAKYHIVQTGYPLHIVHHYTAAPADMEKALTSLRRISRDQRAGAERVIAKRRVVYMPYVAALLQTVSELARPKRFIFSSGGVREGALLSLLRLKENDAQALREAQVRLWREEHAECERYASALLQWLRPLQRARMIPLHLLEMACAAAETGRRQGDFRAETAYHFVLYSDLLSGPHAERAWLACALAGSYISGPEENKVLLGEVTQLLSEQERKQAEMTAASLRLARGFSGECPGALECSGLTISDGALILEYHPSMAALLTSGVMKRLDKLAAIMGLRSSARVASVSATEVESKNVPIACRLLRAESEPPPPDI